MIIISKTWFPSILRFLNPCITLAKDSSFKAKRERQIQVENF